MKIGGEIEGKIPFLGSIRVFMEKDFGNPEAKQQAIDSPPKVDPIKTREWDHITDRLAVA
jgi:hypothetical protein